VVAVDVSSALSHRTAGDIPVHEGDTSAPVFLISKGFLPVSKLFPLATDASKSKHLLLNPRCCPEEFTCKSISFVYDQNHNMFIGDFQPEATQLSYTGRYPFIRSKSISTQRLHTAVSQITKKNKDIPFSITSCLVAKF
jgi:hypothetical protein